jgi:CO/xanthine dehydrogenase FAD-binding subunit
MTPLEYLLPETMDEALEYLERGVPLAGGTGLTPRRNGLEAVVDLRNLGLDRIESAGDLIKIGATATLQRILEVELKLPDKLREVCKLEAGWNIRNKATVGGVIMSADGRSPLLALLLALDARVIQEPGGMILALNDLLDHRQEVKLITEIQFDTPSELRYKQVSRAPADFPLVNAAVACWNVEGKEKFAIVVGGHADRPLRLFEAETLLSENMDIHDAATKASDVYSSAGDEWASAEYRSAVVGILVDRLLREVIN